MLYRFLIVALLCALPLVARAQEPPHAGIDFSTVMADLDGKPMKDGAPSAADPDCSKCSDMTLGRAASAALCAHYQDDTRKPEDQFADCTLGLRLRSATAPVTDLSAEQIAEIKKLIAKAWNPLIQTRAWPLLDPAKP